MLMKDYITDAMIMAAENTPAKLTAAFDKELVEAFNLGTLEGTVDQLTIVLSALRTSAVYISQDAAFSDIADIDAVVDDEDASDHKA